MLRVFSSLWEAVGGTESWKQFVASFQVLYAEQPGILLDEPRFEGGEAGGTDLRRCLSATTGRQLGALLMKFPQGLGSKAKQLVSERFGHGGIALGKVAGESIENLFPGDVAAVLPLPKRMLRRTRR